MAAFGRKPGKVPKMAAPAPKPTKAAQERADAIKGFLENKYTNMQRDRRVRLHFPLATTAALSALR